MFTITLTPRFYETDAFGHINNTVYNGWMEAGRIPIFDYFTDGDDTTDVSLMLVRTEVDFLGQTYFGQDVELHTFIESVGNKSFIIGHELYQGERMVAKGKAVQVHFSQQQQHSMVLTDEQKATLSSWMKAE